MIRARSLLVLFALQAACGGSTGGDDGSPSASAPAQKRDRACRSLSGEPSDRVGACLGELKNVRPSTAFTKELVESAGPNKVLVTAGGPLTLPEGTKVQQLPLTLDDVGKKLLARSEKEASAALRDAGVRAVVVHRDLVGALDRDRTVLARLANHDQLEWFQLRHVSDDLFLYTVRASAMDMPEATGAALLAGLRARLEGREPAAQTWDPENPRLIASIRLHGNTLAFRHEIGPKIEGVLDGLADKLAREWEREAVPEGHGRLRDRLDEARLEIHVVTERAAVEPRSAEALADLWELGIDGMMLRQRDGASEDKFTYMPGSEAMARSIRTADEFLRLAVRKFDWSESRPWVEDPRTRLDIIRTQHFIERTPGGGGAARLYRGMPEVELDAMTDAVVQQMLVDGSEWWLRNMRPDGTVLYKYWPDQNRESIDYNEVRHILAARDLADTFRYRADPRYLDGSKRNMDWLMKFAVTPDAPADPKLPSPPADTLLFRFPARQTQFDVPNQKLGTVAVALLGWIAWARSTGSHAEDEHIRQMASFVRARQDESGAFDAYFVPKDHPYSGMKNDIVPGEAALALGEVSDYFDEPEWISTFPKFLDYYEPWFRERAKRVNPFGRWPHDTYDNQTRLDLVQFGPWAIMACRKYYALTGDERAAKFGLEIADWMIDSYQWTAKRAPFPDYAGGYYKTTAELPAMQSFCYSEGTAAAYGIAQKFAPDRKEKYALATKETIRFLSVMQYDDVDSYFAAEPGLIHGGIKYALNENKIRIDYLGHGLSTLVQYLDNRATDAAAKEPFKLIPPTNLAALPIRYVGAGAGLRFIDGDPASPVYGLSDDPTPAASREKPPAAEEEGGD
jgi:hypothetical protein